MVFVTSDLHGFSLEKFKCFLQKVKFKATDYLYILGDVIDRGPDGVKLLQWIKGEPNVKLILGNHEAMLLSCTFLFEEITEASIFDLSSEALNLYATWSDNGGDATITALYALKKEEGGKEKIQNILDFLRETPLYDAVTVNGKDYIFTHSGLGNFREDKRLREYSSADLLFSRPNLNTQYFKDMTVIFGHTPTLAYGREYTGRIIKTDTWIDIDVGVGIGQDPILYRLDDEKCFYYKYIMNDH